MGPRDKPEDDTWGGAGRDALLHGRSLPRQMLGPGRTLAAAHATPQVSSRGLSPGYIGQRNEQPSNCHADRAAMPLSPEPEERWIPGMKPGMTSRVDLAAVRECIGAARQRCGHPPTSRHGRAQAKRRSRVIASHANAWTRAGGHPHHPSRAQKKSRA